MLNDFSLLLFAKTKKKTPQKVRNATNRVRKKDASTVGLIDFAIIQKIQIS